MTASTITASSTQYLSAIESVPCPSYSGKISGWSLMTWSSVRTMVLMYEIISSIISDILLQPARLTFLTEEFPFMCGTRSGKMCL